MCVEPTAKSHVNYWCSLIGTHGTQLAVCNTKWSHVMHLL